MLTALSADAVTYHDSLAAGWDRRYKKRSFQVRETVLSKCLRGRDLSGGHWLDAGCGAGTLARLLAERGCNVLGVDAAPEMISVAEGLANSSQYSDRLKFARVGTIAGLPIDDGSLNGVLCSSVLEYVPNSFACLKEFSRVLKPEGLLLVSVPNRNSLVRRLQLACHHVASMLKIDCARFLNYSLHQYSVREFEALLADAGFRVDEVVSFGSPLPALAQHSRCWASLLMFVAHKS